MRSLTIALNLLLVWATLSAQPTPVTDSEAPQTAEIRGTVHSITGEPIPRAIVRVRPTRIVANPGAAPLPTVSTDDEGNFAILNLAPGTYTLTAERPGYLTQPYGTRAVGSNPSVLSTLAAPVQLVAGQVLKGIDIAMTPQAVITGHVTDVYGDPVPNVSVIAAIYSWTGGRRELVSTVGQRTDDEGNYRLSGLSAGRYFIRASPQRTILSGDNPNGSQPVGDIQTFHPGAEETQLATPIAVRPGDEIRGIDIQLIRRPMYSISGTIQGESVPRNLVVRVYKLNSKGDVLAYGTSRALLRPEAAEFRISGLPPGRYRVESFPANTPPGQSSPVFVREEFTINDSDIEDAVLIIRDAFSISGTVTLDGGDIAALIPEQTPAPGSKGPARAAGSTGPTITIDSEDSEISVGTRSPVQDDGSFEAIGLSTRRYRVRAVRLPAGTYVKQIRFNGQDITHSLMDLTSIEGGELEITLSTQAADISGVVHDKDGAPVIGADLILWPKTQDPDRIAREAITAVADQNGLFQMTSLAPGDYYLLALASPEPGIHQSPDFLAQLASQAEEVEISEGAHLAVQLDMLPPEAIARAVENMP